MNSDAPITFILIFLLSMIVFLFGVISKEKQMQKEAVANNAAHWATDTNGAPVFTWGK